MSTLSSLPPARHLALVAPSRARAPSVTDRVARVFPPAACIRGYSYFERKRVELGIASESKVDAVVKGKRTQHVSVRVQGARLGTTCTCSAATVGPASCRHVWATLLEIDRLGALESLRGSRAILALAPIEVDRQEALAEPQARDKSKAKAKARAEAGAKPKVKGKAKVPAAATKKARSRAPAE